MKTPNTIRVDFIKAINQAEQLEDVARKMKGMANREMDEILQRLSGAWKGEAARAYIQKGCQLQNKINQNARNLKKSAETIRSIAEKTYQAEMKAYRLAQERLYKNES